MTFLVGTEVLARLALALLPCFNRIISLSVKTQRIAGIHYKIKGSSLRRMPVLVGRQTKGGRRQCNLVPRAFPLKNGWPHPFLREKPWGRVRAVALPGNWEAGLKRLKRFRISKRHTSKKKSVVTRACTCYQIQ